MSDKIFYHFGACVLMIKCSGVSLIEVLVALVVLSGVSLGLAGTLLHCAHWSKTSYDRLQEVEKIYTLHEKEQMQRALFACHVKE